MSVSAAEAGRYSAARERFGALASPIVNTGGRAIPTARIADCLLAPGSRCECNGKSAVGPMVIVEVLETLRMGLNSLRSCEASLFLE
jgi:hypothetical protein